MSEFDHLLLIGECPSDRWQLEAYDPLGPHSSSGKQLQKILGVTAGQLRSINRLNLIVYPTGDLKWPAGEALWAAQGLRNSGVLQRYSNVLLLGSKVTKAFGLKDLEPFKWVIGNPAVGMIPHPSGLNRFWNDPANVEKAREFVMRTVCGNPYTANDKYDTR